MSTSTTPNLNHKLHIAIIGAGPAGLTLANLLHTSPLSSHLTFTIFEGDAPPGTPNARPSQGGSLDLHATTGLAALSKAHLLASFRKHARYDGDEMNIADKNGTVLVHKPASAGIVPKGDEESRADDRPEIDRGNLNLILREKLPEGVIQWNHRLESCGEDGMLNFTISNSSGSQKTNSTTSIGPFDLIIGADGAWSRVRPMLTTIKPTYSGISGYELTIPSPSTTCPHVNTMVGKGSFGSNSDGKFLNAQRMGDGSLKIRSWYNCPEFSAQDTLDKLGAEGTLTEILGRYEGWAPELLELLRQAEVKSVRVWPCYELPVGHTWEHRERFTLIGDASSLAAPFSGEGVNKAMKDALDLVTFLEEALAPPSQSSSSVTTQAADPPPVARLDDAMRKYEISMFPRAHNVQRKTKHFMDIFLYSSDGPITAVPKMIKAMTSDHESTLVRVLGGSAPVMALAYAYLWMVASFGAVRRRWRGT